MAQWTVFNAFTEALAEGVHNLAADNLQVILTNTAPSATDSVRAQITEISAAGGYAPVSVTGMDSAQVGGTYTLGGFDSVTFTPSGAPFDAARYWVLFNNTATNDELIAWADYGVSYAAPDGTPWTLEGGSAVFTLAANA